MSALLVNQGRISTGASASPSHRRRFKKSSVATNLGGGEERSSTRSRSSAVNTHGSASFQRLDDRDVAVGHGAVRWRRLATRPSRRVLRRADAAVPGPTTPEVAMSPSKLGWDTAMSASTLVQLGVCAATMVVEPVLGSIDTFWVAALGTTELSALGPNTTLYGCVIAVIVAYGFGTAATRKIAVALELDEAHRKSGTLKPGEKTTAGGTLIAVTVTTVAFGLACGLLIALFPNLIVNAIGSPESVVVPAAQYMQLRAMGVPAVGMVVALGGGFQAARDAKTPFIAVMLSGVVNLVLDPLLMFTFGLGMSGAALATVTAQYSSAILMTYQAFFGKKRAMFFGSETESVTACVEGETCDEVDLTEEPEEPVKFVEPARYDFNKKVAMEYTQETGSYMGRVANVVVVWTLTGSLAMRLGVFEGAAHVLLFQLLSIMSISAGALTTVCNALCARLFVSVGDEAASAAGKALTILGGVVFSAISALFWVFRKELLFAYTPDPVVVSTALDPYFLLIASVATYWYKTLEGGLIGRGDANAVNFIFYIGGAAALVSLWYFNQSAAGITLMRIWWAVVWYYSALAVGCTFRWWQLGRLRRKMPPTVS